MDAADRRYYAFGPFVLDAGNRQLLRGGQSVAITGRVFDVLLVLVEHAGQPIAKDTLLDRIWGDVTVEEGNLARNVSTLRKILGESPDDHRYVVTLPGRGYQFVAPVKPWTPAPAPASGQESSGKPGAGSRNRWRHGLATAAAGGLLVAAVVGWLVARRSDPAPAAALPLRLVVLPFENLSGDPQQEAFVDGLTEEMIAELGRLNPSRLAVIARTSAMSFKGTRPSVGQIRDTLDVDYVVEGSARQTDDTVRITALLIEAEGETQIWSQSYDRQADDALVIQQDVARSIAREIRIELTPDAAARLANVRTIDLEAHRAYVEGRRYLSLGNESDIRRAIERFDTSIARDPGYALAHAGLADAAIALTDYYVSPVETAPRGREAARRAVELDGGLAEARASLATVHMLFDWDWPAAEREYRRAIALQPGYADAHSWYAYYLALMGRSDEALAEVKVAESLDPLSVAVQLNAAWVSFLARRPEEAEAHIARAHSIDPHGGATHGSLWVAYAPIPSVIGRLKADRVGATPLVLASLAGAAAVSGNREEAERLLDELRTTVGYVCPYEMASAYAALSRPDEAFEYLERSYEERSPCLPDLGVDPRFDALRADPRLRSLLERLRMIP